MINDKHNIIETIESRTFVVLDVGCGPGKKKPEWIGIDALDFEGVDIVGNIYEIVTHFPDKSVDEIHSYHFFEHIPDIVTLLQEFQRILKNGGVIKTVVPHFSNAYFYSDYTHKHFFGLYSMSYLVKDNLFRRRVPNYQVHIDLTLDAVHLRFSSPFLITRMFRKFYEVVINSSNLFKEIYEDSWSRNFPCYEIEYIMKK
ncbi:class I SAM-dependent methyltransferase [Niabella beijingensis]|uniref:class I SAM-dependent methyltransferase n=1 Tax=Niabella beijingensis TaxID=2872700 RepID=UPI001CBAC532|nr:class I SAM-dependent methyltransferase [Niabella beijingensis]MBZ4190000.1 class I SAM-dependent methyltransferase [Niabella beijingensis]